VSRLILCIDNAPFEECPSIEEDNRETDSTLKSFRLIRSTFGFKVTDGIAQLRLGLGSIWVSSTKGDLHRKHVLSLLGEAWRIKTKTVVAGWSEMFSYRSHSSPRSSLPGLPPLEAKILCTFQYPSALLVLFRNRLTVATITLRDLISSTIESKRN
jgi:hypothetical protein